MSWKVDFVQLSPDQVKECAYSLLYAWIVPEELSDALDER